MFIFNRNILILITCFLFVGAGYGGQTAIRDYEQARSMFWRGLYSKGGKTLYCRDVFGSRDRGGINIEHVFPMSWVTKELNCGRRKQCRQFNKQFNLIEADLHNLFPARRDLNDARGSYRFGMLQGEPRRFGRCDFEVDQRRRVVEPAPGARGEIARAMFYMKEQYDLTIFRKLGQTLKRWHQQDPPSKHERWRNDRIEKIQGTRNRFVDDPMLVDGIRF